MEENGATIEIPLPEAMIQHIQSFMSAKEAARSTLLSRSWYNAWLTRPSIDIDEDDFDDPYLSTLRSIAYLNEDAFRNRCIRWWNVFTKFSNKTMQRYRESRLKIDSFRLRLCTNSFGYRIDNFAHNLIVSAMETGATDLKLELWSSLSSFTLPKDVLGSTTLLRLSVSRCKIYGAYAIRCSRLKSLDLKVVTIRNSKKFKDIIESCSDSLEELSLSLLEGTILSQVNLFELRNLRRLFLDSVTVECIFFSDFASRFPCLKDLTILHCHGWRSIQIASTSLESLRFETRESRRVTFDAPNIRKFTYSGLGLPSNSLIKGGSRECELDLYIKCKGSYNTSWFLSLKSLLSKFRPWGIVSLYIKLDDCGPCSSSTSEDGADEAVAGPLVVVENLTIDAEPSSFCRALLVRLFGICRPKLVTHYKKETLDFVCEGLMHKLITPSCGIPHQDMFGQFGLKKVNMEVHEELYPVCPENKQKVRFELMWD